MNATLKHLRGIGNVRHTVPSTQATENAGAIRTQHNSAVGSYGRGVYAGHTTYAQDFSTQSSYGRGTYAGRSTAEISFDAPGSYGRGVYSGRSTAEHGFTTQGSFASHS